MATQIMVDNSYVDGTPNGPDDENFLLGPVISDDGLASLGGLFEVQVYAPEISADGSVVAYEGACVSRDSQTTRRIRLRLRSIPVHSPKSMRATSAIWTIAPLPIVLASSYADGTPMPFGAIDPALSADGKFVAFWSWGNDDQPEVFVKISRPANSTSRPRTPTAIPALAMPPAPSMPASTRSRSPRTAVTSPSPATQS